MNKLLKLCFILLSSTSIISCSNNDTSNTSETSNTTNTTNTSTNTSQSINNVDRFSSDGIKELEKQYGKLKITREDGRETNYTYNESTNEYKLAVEDIKAKYVISGFTTSHFVIENTNNITTYKGLKIKLDKACIIPSNEYTPIYYSLDSKNIEISAKSDTSNIIASLNGFNAIDSENNIELGGKGTLDIYTKSTRSDGSIGHCIKSSNKVSIYDSINLNLESAHDGINCDELLTKNSDEYCYDVTCI